jgi:hypothetical protein
MRASVIAARRQEILDEAPCEGCGGTLETCKANRGKDPTAPKWFGCCARGLDFRPCVHVPSVNRLLALLEEIESGRVQPVLSEEDKLLSSLSEGPSISGLRRMGPREGLLDGIYSADYYARDEYP